MQRREPLGTKTSLPLSRACSSPSTITIPEPETPSTSTSTSSLICSPTPRPGSKRTRLALRSSPASKVHTTPARSPAEVATSSRSTRFPAPAKVLGPAPRGDVEQAHRVRERLEPVPLLHHQQHHVQALAFAQRDRVACPLPPLLLLAQTRGLYPQIEALQPPT